MREGENKYKSLFPPHPYCCGAGVLVWFLLFFSHLPLQFSLFSLSEGRRGMRNSNKSLQIGKHGFSMPLCNYKQKYTNKTKQKQCTHPPHTHSHTYMHTPSKRNSQPKASPLNSSCSWSENRSTRLMHTTSVELVFPPLNVVAFV